MKKKNKKLPTIKKRDLPDISPAGEKTLERMTIARINRKRKREGLKTFWALIEI